MGFGEWFAQNWFVLLQSAGIIGGLLFTGLTLRQDTKTRRVSNLITITEHHREIWTDFYRRSELGRVLEGGANLKKTPVTQDEEMFVTQLILHLNSVYHAMQDGLLIKPEGLRRDIAEFFALPIPSAVWENIKAFQDREFVRFIESAQRGLAMQPDDAVPAF